MLKQKQNQQMAKDFEICLDKRISVKRLGLTSKSIDSRRLEARINFLAVYNRAILSEFTLF